MYTMIAISMLNILIERPDRIKRAKSIRNSIKGRAH